MLANSPKRLPLTVYTHLFADDHADAMAALGALGTQSYGGNMVPLHG